MRRTTRPRARSLPPRSADRDLRWLERIAFGIIDGNTSTDDFLHQVRGGFAVSFVEFRGCVPDYYQNIWRVADLLNGGLARLLEGVLEAQYASQAEAGGSSGGRPGAEGSQAARRRGPA